MIPRFNSARLIREDIWMVSFTPEEGSSSSLGRLVPTVENPSFCPGGVWCEQMGCKEKFEEAEAVIVGEMNERTVVEPDSRDIEDWDPEAWDIEDWDPEAWDSEKIWGL